VTLLTVGLLVIGGLNVEQKRKWIDPDDGCSWIQSGDFVQAQQVARDGPAAHAGIQPGYILHIINVHRI
jgi:predicted metalloprotease with PDZ domain